MGKAAVMDTSKKDEKKDLRGTMAATRDYYGKKLVELGHNHEDIVVFDADLSGSTRTNWFADQFPERFFNMGIAEANMMGFATGMALSGKIVFVSTFAMFATLRPYEQVRNSIAAQNCNVKIAATHAGVTVGEDGMSHQAIEDIAIMRVLPNMRVFVPADAVSAAKIVEKSAEIYGPVYIRLSRHKTRVLYNDDYTFTPGKATIIKDQPQARVAFIACGTMVSEGLEAAQMLEKEGIPAIVADFASVKPLDTETLAQIALKSRVIVTLEEHNIIGGLGGAVCEALADEYPMRVKRIGVNDIYGESGTPDELFHHLGLKADHIYRKVMKWIQENEA